MSDKDERKALAANIGGNLAALRKATKWTQGQLAEKIGVETETVSRFERGVTLPSLVTLQELAVALNTTLGDLVGESSPMPNDQGRVVAAWLKGLKTKDRVFAVEMLRLYCEHLGWRKA